MTKNEILIHVIITAVISTARHLTDKGEHTAVYTIRLCRLGRDNSWMCQADHSVLQIYQLTGLRPTKEWWRDPHRFPRLYDTLLPENLGNSPSRMASKQNRVRDQAFIKNKKQTARSHSVHWWLSHQRPVRVNKQGATTIHEDSAAYTVLTSSLTMEREAVTHALRWIASRGDSQGTHAIFLTDSMSLLQKVEWEAQTGMCQWSTSNFENSWACRNEGKSPSRQTGGKSNPHKWLASGKIWSADEAETLPAGTKPRTSHHRSPGGERRWKRKR